MNEGAACGFWGGFWPLVRAGEISKSEIRSGAEEPESFVIDAGSVSETQVFRKSNRSLPCQPDVPSGTPCVVCGGMDKKEINSSKMTVNFLIWVGGVFMLLLFAFLAHFVWRIL
jgi:hypothetical protein